MRRRPIAPTILFLTVFLLLACALVALLITSAHLLIIAAVVLAAVLLIIYVCRYVFPSDHVRAQESERTLRLATQTLPFMRQGLTFESAQAVCDLLLPATRANSVAITNREIIMGFAGAEKESHPIGWPVVTTATISALRDGQQKVILTQDEIGFQQRYSSMQAAIVIPLTVHEEPVGVLKFYYRLPQSIDETQRAMTLGLAALLEMQLQLAELEDQREVATQMRLKALQAQINPHFLFNTINTIASLIRTDPSQARILLREFAAFYRNTLEGSLDFVTLEQEYLQTLRYFGFELARFGAERLSIDRDFAPGLDSLMVPAFILQPLVENAVGHALVDDRPLHVHVKAELVDGIVRLIVSDDGAGMSDKAQRHMLDPDREHAGIALRNVDERLRGFFGAAASLAVQSKLGKGTTVTLTLGSYEQMKVLHED